MNETDWKLLYEQTLESLEEEIEKRKHLEAEIANLHEVLKQEQDRFAMSVL